MVLSLHLQCQRVVIRRELYSHLCCYLLCHYDRRYVEAQTCLETALKHDPCCVSALFNLGKLLLGQQQQQQSSTAAADLFNRCVYCSYVQLYLIAPLPRRALTLCCVTVRQCSSAHDD